MRYIMSAILVCAVFILVTTVGLQSRVALDPYIYTYVTTHFLADTDAKNAVAAILLNYRMYDTMFEALILLTAIIGMQQFLPLKADIEAGEDAAHE